MTGSNIGILKAATQKMHWHEARQKYIADAVSNANTPRYVPKDLEPLKFKEMLAKTSASLSVKPAITSGKHLSSAISSNKDTDFKVLEQKDTYETSPTGNSVVLEEQLMKMNNNQLDHRLTTTIYKKTINALKKSVQSK